MKRKLIAAVALFAVGGTALTAQPLATLKTDIGKVVVAAKNGMTLYTFRKDAPNKSNCYNDCAAAWPPFMASGATKPSGQLGIITRKDNSRQWTRNGQPLYFWQGDAARGDVTGDGVGGVWDAVKN